MNIYCAIMGLVIIIICMFGFLIYRAKHKKKREALQVTIEEQAKQLEALNKELLMIKNFDALTGLPTKQHLKETLEKEWRRAERNSLPISLIMADIDSFESFIETYGEQKSEQCLKTVSKIMKDSVGRPGDLVVRFEGSTFAIMLPGIIVEGAITVAERIRRKVESYRIPHQKSETNNHITVSFGISVTIPRRTKNSHSLIETAKNTLIEAKEKGGNQYRVFFKKGDLGI